MIIQTYKSNVLTKMSTMIIALKRKNITGDTIQIIGTISDNLITRKNKNFFKESSHMKV